MSSRPHPPSRPSPPVPKTVKLTPHALLSLPHRLAHPPPPQPKINSWGITPHYRIPLDEILDRKHLPPLGLKDFEEWLLFIDRTPECLYFILWLREYKSRYTTWMRQYKPSTPIRCSSNPGARTYRSVSAPPPPNPSLTQFYLRAKETFLTPYAPYALPVPLDLLAPFYSSMDVPGYRPPDHLLGVPGTPPPPYPEVFEEVEERVLAMLTESLDRFVLATFHNVGMPRAYCGCAGGTVIGLTGSAPILLANFLTGGSRWWRFSALPGLWLGMTIVISAMYGVCMMIYVFGDLRQLRSFELARVPDTDHLPISPTRETKSKITLVAPALGTELPAGPMQELSSPPSPSMSRPAPEDLTAAYRLPTNHLPRVPPPRLRLNPPAPVHTVDHIHTSTRAHPSHAHALSMSSASTSYSVKFQRSTCSHTLYDEEEDYGASDSDFESDCDTGSESDASSEDHHHEYDIQEESNTDADIHSKPHQRQRRRRRREPEILISDAIFDEDPSPEGPAMGESHERSRRSSVWGESSEEEISMGATFIHPFRWDDVDEYIRQSLANHDIESQAYCAAEHQRMDSFDFNGLPPRAPRHTRTDSFAGSVLHSPTTPSFVSPTSAFPSVAAAADTEKPSREVHFATDVDTRRRAHAPTGERPLGRREAPSGLVGKFLGLLQAKCGPRNVAMYLLGGRSGDSDLSVTATESGTEVPPEKHASAPASASSGPISPTSTLSPPSVVWPGSPASEKTVTGVPISGSAPGSKGQEREKTPVSWQKRVRRMLEVPAFASPLTPVLNPVVTRGQWEIVVRSAVIAFVLSLAIVGGLVAAPETSVS